MGGSVEFRRTALTIDRLKAIECHLSSLVTSCEEANPFFAPLMLQPVCQFLLGSGHHFLFEVWQRDQLIGVLPLQQENKLGSLPLKHFQSLKWRHGYLATPLIKTGYSELFVTALLDWLDQEQGAGSLLSLPLQIRDGVFMQCLLRHIKSQNRAHSIVASYERAAQNLQYMDYDSYVASTLSQNSRKKLRTKIRKLEELGTVTYERNSARDNIDIWLRDFLSLEHSGWKGAGGTSIQSDPADEAFWQYMVSAANKLGVLHFSRLKLNDEVIATSIDIALGRTLFALKIAHNTSYEKFSPGVLLEHKNIQAAFENEEISLIDSCASPDHPVLNDIMSERRTMTHLLIAKKSMASESLLRTIIGVRAVKAKLKSRLQND